LTGVPLQIRPLRKRHDPPNVWTLPLERAEATKKAQFLDAKEGDLGEALRAGQHTKQAQKQDLIERVGHLALLTRVRQVTEMIKEDNGFPVSCTVRYRVVHCPSPACESRIGIDSAL
jgi:hypothetical protein